MIGIIIVVFSLNQLIREIRKAGIPNMEDQSFSDTFYKLLTRVEKMGDDIDDINQTFYESTERLEKRMDALEKRSLKPEPGRWPVREATGGQPLTQATPAQTDRTAAERALHSSDEMRVAVEITRLLKEGKDSQQVAKELNLGVGEVELIRRLRPEQKRGV